MRAGSEKDKEAFALRRQLGRLGPLEDKKAMEELAEAPATMSEDGKLVILDEVGLAEAPATMSEDGKLVILDEVGRCQRGIYSFWTR